MFAIPAVLSAAFLALAAHLSAFSIPLAGLILAYTFLPAAVAYLARDTPPPTWLDFVIIALLWFPLEFSVGHQWIPVAGAKHAASGRLRRFHSARPLDISAVPAALRDENQPSAIGPRSRQPADRLCGLRASVDRAGTRDRLPAAISSARAAVSGAHWIAVSDHPGCHRASGRNPIPWTDPEFHRTDGSEPARARCCLPRLFLDARISTMDPSRFQTGAT